MIRRRGFVVENGYWNHNDQQQHESKRDHEDSYDYFFMALYDFTDARRFFFVHDGRLRSKRCLLLGCRYNAPSIRCMNR